MTELETFADFAVWVVMMCAGVVAFFSAVSSRAMWKNSFQPHTRTVREVMGDGLRALPATVPAIAGGVLSVWALDATRLSITGGPVGQAWRSAAETLPTFLVILAGIFLLGAAASALRWSNTSWSEDEAQARRSVHELHGVEDPTPKQVGSEMTRLRREKRALASRSGARAATGQEVRR